MQLGSLPKPKRRSAMTVLCGDKVVFSDPLSHALFGKEPPEIPKGEEKGRFFTAPSPYLLFRRDILFDATEYAVYIALPVSAGEAQNAASLAALFEAVLEEVYARFFAVIGNPREARPFASLSVLYFFRSVTERICADLYAPLSIDVAGGVENGSISLDRATCLEAIGLALSALLCEGQTTLTARLSGDDNFYVLSFVGDRGICSEFIRHLLNVLAERGGFAVRHTETGVRFLLFPSHSPAAVLRSDPTDDLVYLSLGFFLLT